MSWRCDHFPRHADGRCPGDPNFVGPSIAQFLRERIAGDEAVARPLMSDKVHAADASGIELDGEYYALNISPRRVLAECEAKRRILEYDPGAYILCALALPYSDHPDYRQEWKP